MKKNSVISQNFEKHIDHDIALFPDFTNEIEISSREKENEIYIYYHQQYNLQELHLLLV